MNFHYDKMSGIFIYSCHLKTNNHGYKQEKDKRLLRGFKEFIFNPNWKLFFIGTTYRS